MREVTSRKHLRSNRANFSYFPFSQIPSFSVYSIMVLKFKICAISALEFKCGAMIKNAKILRTLLQFWDYGKGENLAMDDLIHHMSELFWIYTLGKVK